MRISQLKSLSENELSLLVHVLNVLEPINSPRFEVKKPSDILFVKHDALLWKLAQQEKNLTDEGRPIFVSLMTKLNRTAEQETEFYEHSSKPEFTQSEFHFYNGGICLEVPANIAINIGTIEPKSSNISNIQGQPSAVV